jgi:transposase
VQIDLTALPDDPDVLQRMLREVVPELQAENEKLLLLVERLLRHRFGPRSEKLDLDQLRLGLEDEEQGAAEDEAARDAAEAPDRPRRTQPANRNRGALPAHLPRFEVIIDVESKKCPCCGGTLHMIGEDRTEQLDIVPAQLRVKVLCRPRYGCRGCEGAVVQAPAPERPIDGGMATEALIAHVVVSKFCDSLPLYRQAQMLKRQGITLDRSTLSTWVGRACWWLKPLYELVVSTVLSTDKVFADETTLPVLEPGRGKTKTGRLWCYAVDDRPWTGPTHPAAGVSTRPPTWRHSGAPCKWTAMPGSATWSKRARMPRSSWLSAGPTRGGRSTSSILRPSRRSRLKCWHASPSSTKSKATSVANRPICAKLFVSCEVDRWSRHCTFGYRSTCRAFPAGQTWQKPCAMHCGIGTD